MYQADVRIHFVSKNSEEETMPQCKKLNFLPAYKGNCYNNKKIPNRNTRIMSAIPYSHKIGKQISDKFFHVVIRQNLSLMLGIIFYFPQKMVC
jgi:hypothetical protein